MLFCVYGIKAKLLLSTEKGSADEIMAITDDQYRMLMQGLEVVARHLNTEVAKIPDLM